MGGGNRRKTMSDDFTKENWDKIKKSEPIHREVYGQELGGNWDEENSVKEHNDMVLERMDNYYLRDE